MVLHSTTEINMIRVKYLLHCHCAGLYSDKSGTIVEYCCSYDLPIVDFERNVAEFKLDVKILFYCLELWKKSFKATSTLCCCNDLRERSKSLLISPLATPSWQHSSSAKWSETYSQKTCWLLTLRGRAKWHKHGINNTILLQELIVTCKSFVYNLEKVQ